MRIGIGYDIHRLVQGRKLMLGGVSIPGPRGLEGHSDGDALLHAVCDAILGALGKGDIGERFPDTDPKYKDIPGISLLKDVAACMAAEGFSVGNLDCVVIAEEPKISPYRGEITRIIGDILGVSGAACVSIKGKTAEKLGDIGDKKAIAAYAVVLLKCNTENTEKN